MKHLILLLIVVSAGCSSQWPPTDKAGHVDEAAAVRLRHRWESASLKVPGDPNAVAAIKSLLESSSDGGRTTERVMETRWVTSMQAMVGTEWSTHDESSAVAKLYVYVVLAHHGRWVVLRRYFAGASYACG